METDITKNIQRIREKHPDMVILFRRDNCYTLLGQDAHTARSILRLPVNPMTVIGIDSFVSASFPLSELDLQLPKLVRAGFRVAICDLPNVQQ